MTETQARLNQIIENYLPAETVEQRSKVLQKISIAVGADDPGNLAQAELNYRLVQFFQDCANDLRKPSEPGIIKNIRA